MKKVAFKDSELKKLESKIKKTIKPFISITPIPSPEPLSPLVSKFGGLLYVPSREEWPKDSLGEYMVPLAQLNFEEMPHLEDFPKEGLLQFFISGDIDSSYGVGFDMEGQGSTDQTDFKVRFIQKADIGSTYETDLSWHETYASDMEGGSPIKGEFKLEFKIEEETMGLSDFQFDKAVTDQFVLYKDHEKAWEEYSKFQDHGLNHKVGGYPLLLEARDLRKDNREEHTVLLLQIDDARFSKLGFTYDQYRIDWGGGGVGYFFIRPQDLKELKFDNVLYWWEP